MLTPSKSLNNLTNSFTETDKELDNILGFKKLLKIRKIEKIEGLTNLSQNIPREELDYDSQSKDNFNIQYREKRQLSNLSKSESVSSFYLDKSSIDKDMYEVLDSGDGGKKLAVVSPITKYLNLSQKVKKRQGKNTGKIGSKRVLAFEDIKESKSFVNGMGMLEFGKRRGEGESGSPVKMRKYMLIGGKLIMQ